MPAKELRGDFSVNEKAEAGTRAPCLALFTLEHVNRLAEPVFRTAWSPM